MPQEGNLAVAFFPTIGQRERGAERPIRSLRRLASCHPGPTARHGTAAGRHGRHGYATDQAPWPLGPWGAPPPLVVATGFYRAPIANAVPTLLRLLILLLRNMHRPRHPPPPPPPLLSLPSSAHDVHMPSKGTLECAPIKTVFSFPFSNLIHYSYLGFLPYTCRAFLGRLGTVVQLCKKRVFLCLTHVGAVSRRKVH